ncbi:LytR/AlgR family response regulator transcription factor [Larkinella soli]|uniref:LytR/AlgR family response regulator transcription factor n=1 Tax=Larkinella soli TaxID=1770527 RepID=UPI000FFB2E33|nr:LytTR family DNA-binding domain-containing protein [Larkinella soli]
MRRTSQPEFSYKDTPVAAVAVPLMALAVVHIGNENAFSRLLVNPSYYSDLLLALVLGAVSWGLIRRVVHRLDRRLPWKNGVFFRLAVQFLITAVLCCALVGVIEMIYLEFFLDIRVSASSMLQLELPLTLVFVLIINLIFAVLFFTRLRTPEPDGPKPGLPEPDSDLSVFEPAGAPRRILVQFGKSVVPVPLQEVAFFTSVSETVFVRTFDNREYTYPHSLDRISRELPADDFFRANRTVIVHARAIRKFTVDDTRRVVLETNPAVREPVVVSKNRASAFKVWLKTADR